MSGSRFGSLSSNYVKVTVAVLGTGLACYAACKYLKPRIQSICCSAKDKENVYESEKLLNEYLTFHYGGSSVNCIQSDGPTNGFDFPSRCANLCIKYSNSRDSRCDRALDIGCAVGRSTFDLAKSFREVIGIDFSYGFIRTCEALKKNGQMEYETVLEGDLTTKHLAVVPSDVDKLRCNFRQGDACSLPLDLGQFSCVLAANLICRLPDPKVFLARLSNLVVPGGVCVITSPYTFMREYTPADKWLGGFRDPDGNEVRAVETMKRLLSDFDLIAEENMPFLIRETARKHQWTVAHATVWKRKDTSQISV